MARINLRYLCNATTPHIAHLSCMSACVFYSYIYSKEIYQVIHGE
jgi:hypothetical protein